MEKHGEKAQLRSLPCPTIIPGRVSGAGVWWGDKQQGGRGIGRTDKLESLERGSKVLLAPSPLFQVHGIEATGEDEPWEAPGSKS